MAFIDWWQQAVVPAEMALAEMAFTEWWQQAVVPAEMALAEMAFTEWWQQAVVPAEMALAEMAFVLEGAGGMPSGACSSSHPDWLRSRQRLRGRHR